MWVIYNYSTGHEIDRVEDYAEACQTVKLLNESDVWGYTYSKRWEE